MNHIINSKESNDGNSRIDYRYYMSCTPDIKSCIDREKVTLVANCIIRYGYSIFRDKSKFWESITKSGFKNIEIVDFDYDIEDNKPSTLDDINRVMKAYNYLDVIEQDEETESLCLERGMLSMLIRGAYRDNFSNSDACFTETRDGLMNRMFTSGYEVTMFKRGITEELFNEEQRVLGHTIDADCCYMLVAKKIHKLST